MTHEDKTPNFFRHDADAIAQKLGSTTLLDLLKQMVLIRQFELRAEALYQQGKIGGFLHLYIGQEAIQTAAVRALGTEHWWATTYRCHALAILLGETLHSLMAELLGKKTGNAHGRGGSMHMFSRRMLGGFGIVAGQIPIATGAAFTCKYRLLKDEISVCFFGDGAVANGVFHESLNIASMWELPCLYVIENNKWSMGTPLCRTMANYQHFPEKAAASYGIPYLRLNGMDLLNCYAGFQEAYQSILKTGKPVLVECMTERFRGHSISDPGHYRSKEELKACMQKDPIIQMQQDFIQRGLLTEATFKKMEADCREQVVDAVKAAEGDEWPDPQELEKGVFAVRDICQ